MASSISKTKSSFVSKPRTENMLNVFKAMRLPRFLLDFVILAFRISFALAGATFRMVVPANKRSLLGETVVITGAGHGVGRELAIQLAALGCIIVCWDKDVEANKATMRIISKNGGEVYGYIVDVSNRIEVRKAVKLMKRSGIPEVTMLINNAATLYHRPLLCQTSDNITQTFNVNVLSQFWTIEAFLPSMLQHNKGHIVCMNSMCGFYGISHKVPYCASKFAARGLMEALQEELRFHPSKPKIRFTTIYPFYIDTGLAKNPHYRFSYFFGPVTPKYAASEVIKAIRRNYTEYSIPRCLFTLNAINRVFPEKAMRIILDFLADVDRKRREGVLYDEMRYDEMRNVL